MRKGKKVYDPVKNAWSTGWWVPVYQGNYIVEWLPVWAD